MKVKLGELIEIVDERNKDRKFKNFQGININKEFMPTVADVNNIDESKYKIVRKDWFVFSGMQTGRDECIRIALFEMDEPIIVSPAYTTFIVSATDKLLPSYLMMYFNRRESDRYGWFISDSSIRSNLDWDRFCDIELNLPDIEVQRKFVAVYKAMTENQKCYENGLDDLKLTCDAYIENLRREMPVERIGGYIEQSEERNLKKYGLDNVRGLSVAKEFTATKADMDGVGLDGYKVVSPRSIAFVADTSRRGDKMSLAQNTTNEHFLVSSISTVFNTNLTKLLPEYLMLYFCRSEFDRYARFHSWGSVREVFSFEDMCEVKIPIPSIDKQQSIVNIYKAYIMRREINEKLKTQIKDICRVLIKGASNGH